MQNDWANRIIFVSVGAMIITHATNTAIGNIFQTDQVGYVNMTSKATASSLISRIPGSSELNEIEPKRYSADFTRFEDLSLKTFDK